MPLPDKGLTTLQQKLNTTNDNTEYLRSHLDPNPTRHGSVYMIDRRKGRHVVPGS